MIINDDIIENTMYTIDTKDDVQDATKAKDNVAATTESTKSTPSHYQTQFAHTLSLFDQQPRVGLIPVCGARGRAAFCREMCL